MTIEEVNKMVNTMQIRADLKMERPEPWTARQVFQRITAVMYKQPALQPAVNILDYSLGEEFESWSQKPIPAETWENFTGTTAEISTGGSEGVYTDITLHDYKNPKAAYHLGTFKTLGDDLQAYMLMGMIGGVFVTLFEEWQWVNRKQEEGQK